MPKNTGYTKTNLKVMKPKGGNSKTRKGGRSDAAIAKIATNAVKKIAEKKFMNSNNALLALRPTVPTGLDYVSTIAFSTTTGDSDDGTPISYGSAPVHEMKCLNPFKSTDADSDLRMFAPLGKSITPVSCKTRWRINRDYARMLPAHEQAPPDFFSALAENCPVVCRMIRVSPKLQSGTNTVISPADDLFQDTYGRKVGVNTDGFDQAEMLFYKVNTRRYTVIEDKQFVIRPPLTLQYQVGLEVPGSTKYTALVNNTNGNCEKYMTTYDQLTAKKGGSVFYADPTLADTNNATTGNKRSYYFYHFTYQAADAITGDGTNRALPPTDIVIDVVNTTKFIDV